MDEGVRKKIMAIMQDSSLTEQEKAQKRQEVLSGKLAGQSGGKKTTDDNALNCIICMEMCERPVTAPCQHNFCLSCFKRWVGQTAKNSCPTCRENIPKPFINNPKVNTALAQAIRMAKLTVNRPPLAEQKPFQRIQNDDRPEEAFVTDRAKRTGRANASSGKIMVNVPNYHFGPILPEHDTRRGRGVLVGDYWKDRLDCRQWGAHFPHVAGIAGQSKIGGQSVVLSGGYEDDRDEGEWFLYTGSGGRDLTGNKRVNKNQSSDQEFKLSNEALRISCIRGLPVRVIRSCKERNSAYAPSSTYPVRYDGIYRILRAWRFKGKQKFLMCRYLFVRCDNAPAPWSTSEEGDAPSLDIIPILAKKEIAQAHRKEVHKMCDAPYWGYNYEAKTWGWAKEMPKVELIDEGLQKKRASAAQGRARKQLGNEFKCGICSKIMTDPVSTPCGHTFCKSCLDKTFLGCADTVDRTKSAGRTLRQKKNAWPCPWPRCGFDLCEFLKTAQVNRTMVEVIERLKKQLRVENEVQDENQEGNEEVEDNEEEVDDEQEDTDCPSVSVGTLPVPTFESGSCDEEMNEMEDVCDDKCREDPDGNQPQQVQKTSAEKNAEHRALLAKSLHLEFPNFDIELIEGLMDDQGGDVEEVKGYLRRMMRTRSGRKKRSREEIDDTTNTSVLEDGAEKGDLDKRNKTIKHHSK